MGDSFETIPGRAGKVKGEKRRLPELWVHSN
jgi:hypothetical protein